MNPVLAKTKAHKAAHHAALPSPGGAAPAAPEGWLIPTASHTETATKKSHHKNHLGLKIEAGFLTQPQSSSKNALSKKLPIHRWFL